MLVNQQGHIAWQKALTLKHGWVGKNMGVVAFVQDQSTGEILQGVKLPWCGQ